MLETQPVVVVPRGGMFQFVGRNANGVEIRSPLISYDATNKEIDDAARAHLACVIGTRNIMPDVIETTLSWHFWKFIHNLFVHPLLAFPLEPKWAQRLHDWTANRCVGGG